MLFKSQGCGGCHTFKPAGTNGKIGPDLDKLAEYAKAANSGSLEEFARESIANPSAYVEKGGTSSRRCRTSARRLREVKISDPSPTRRRHGLMSRDLRAARADPEGFCAAPAAEGRGRGLDELSLRTRLERAQRRAASELRAHRGDRPARAS